MVLVHTQIEIEASPEEVRNILLDFPNLSTWHQGFFKAIEYAPGKSTADVGDKLKVISEGMTFEPIVQENSPAELRWIGSLPYIFTGIHSYQFNPSQVITGHTTFVQEENFTGLLSPLMWTSFGTNTKKGFEKINEDLKRKAESA